MALSEAAERVWPMEPSEVPVCERECVCVGMGGCVLK